MSYKLIKPTGKKHWSTTNPEEHETYFDERGVEIGCIIAFGTNWFVEVRVHGGVVDEKPTRVAAKLEVERLVREAGQRRRAA